MIGLGDVLDRAQAQALALVAGVGAAALKTARLIKKTKALTPPPLPKDPGDWLAGVVMSAFGFVSSTGGAAAQSASAITGIVLLYSAIPAALQVGALVIFSRYKLPAG